MRMKINSEEALRSRPILNGQFSLYQLANFMINTSYNANPLKMQLLTLNGLTVKLAGKYHSYGVIHG